jgi:K+-transporting ATPase ATPase B chain
MTVQTKTKARPLFDPPIVERAAFDSLRKLDPRHQVRNPVMFVVEVGSVLTSVLFVQALIGKGEASPAFILAVSAWLWFTVLFANFAEAMAEDGVKPRRYPPKSRRDTSAKTMKTMMRL